MNVTINQITPRRENGKVVSVQVHFTARTEDGGINLNGYVPIEEFAALIDFDGMEQVVRQEVVNLIMNGDLNAE